MWKQSGRSPIYNKSKLFTRAAALIIALNLLTPAAHADINAAKLAKGLPAKTLIPIGRTVGIQIDTAGVLVSGLVDIETKDGTKSPAGEAGMRPGDVIIKVNNTDVQNINEFSAAINASSDTVNLTIRRAEKQMSLMLRLAKTEDGEHRIGAWVRDSMSGIGTITFYDPETSTFGALGHGITDPDTGGLMPLYTGSLMPSSVSGVRKGAVGRPGELMGDIDSATRKGNIYANGAGGLFGCVDSNELYPSLLCGEPLPVAKNSEIKPGYAVIMSNVAGEEIVHYTVEIVKIIDPNRETKNMMIKVTDQRLIDITGGIVQGMSGSPIIQNGKIVGAITHVLVDDPKSGYGIFISNMLADCVYRVEQIAA